MARRHGYSALGSHTPAALDSATIAITTSKQTLTAAKRHFDPATATAIAIAAAGPDAFTGGLNSAPRSCCSWTRLTTTLLLAERSATKRS